MANAQPVTKLLLTKGRGTPGFLDFYCRNLTLTPRRDLDVQTQGFVVLYRHTKMNFVG